MSCYFCGCPRESWTGYFCNSCQEMSRITKVYGQDEVLEILRTTCIRNRKQIKNKIEIIKKEQEEVEKKPSTIVTRSQQKKKEPVKDI